MNNNVVPNNLPIFGQDEAYFRDTASVKVPHLVVPPVDVIAHQAALEARAKALQLSLVDFLWEYKVKLSTGIFTAFFIVYTFMAVFGFLPRSLTPEPTKQVVAKNTITAPAVLPATSASGISSDTSRAAAPTPTSVSKTKNTAPSVAPATKNKSTDPIRVVIGSIGVDTRVSNPSDSSNTVLDENLKRGAVRYPDSAPLGGGNTFIFAHSTNHQVVVNPAYKAFNNFDKLEAGDVVTVYSLDRVYTYKIKTVRLAPASEIYVDLATNKNMLTLVTCNTFGAKEDRYIAEAVFVGSEVLTEETI